MPRSPPVPTTPGQSRDQKKILPKKNSKKPETETASAFLFPSLIGSSHGDRQVTCLKSISYQLQDDPDTETKVVDAGYVQRCGAIAPGVVHRGRLATQEYSQSAVDKGQVFRKATHTAERERGITRDVKARKCDMC